jgi:hypothetical protein
MDLVYIVGKDPAHGHVELRYSLRSMFKYLSRIDHVFIVGERPEFLRDVIHIPAADKFKYNAGRNIYEKMATACLHRDLSSHFWCAADDHFLLAPLSQKGYPYFYLGSLWETLQKLGKESKFKPYVEATFWALHDRGLPTKNFNSHLPMIFQKNIFIELMDSFDWDLSKSYTVKGLYPNALKIPGVKISDSKFHTSKTKTAIYRQLAREKAFFFSTNEHSINEAMIEVLGELYPNPSPWEIPDHSHFNKIISIQDLGSNGNKSLK